MEGYSRSGEAAAHEARGERALSSVYFEEKGTGEMMILQVSGLIASLHQQKMKGPSRFCDVCGHMTPAPEVKCKSCPCSFHKVCLGLQPLDEVTDDWICHACKRLSIEQAKQPGESTELLPMDEVGAQEPRRERALSSVYFDEVDTGDIPASPWSSSPRARGGEAAAREPRRERASSLLSPSLILGDKAKSSHVASKGKGKEEPVEKRKFLFSARTRWKPPDSPMQCSSCGYHETEAMNCDSCSRWFCFACMCLSAETLPANTWSCPECIGQDHYDEGRRVLIEASCRRVMEGKVTAKEQDGFSQLVFDLSCTCDWDEWERNIDALIDHVKKQLEKGEVPVVMPFHSLHYARKGKAGIKTAMDKSMIKQISIAYSKWSKEEAYKLARVKMLDDGRGCEEFHVWKPVRLKFAPSDTQ